MNILVINCGSSSLKFQVINAESEKLLAELAVERADESTIEAIKQKHQTLVDAAQAGQDAAKLSPLNREFHLAVMRAGAPYLADRVLKPMWKTAIPTSQSQWDSPELVQHFLDKHGQIVAAIESRDAELAGKLMGDHVFAAYQERLSRKKA